MAAQETPQVQVHDQVQVPVPQDLFDATPRPPGPSEPLPAGPVATTFHRHDVRFRSTDSYCAAWHYLPAGELVGPLVVMAHGFGCSREMALPRYAERFAAAGYQVLLFDYRGFGGSGGTRRQSVSVRRQLADWRAAVSYARELPTVAPDRVALWGTSFSAGHVLRIAAEDSRIAAVISQLPQTSGPAVVRAHGLLPTIGIGVRGLLDLGRALVGARPLMLDLFGEKRSRSPLATGASAQKFLAECLAEGTTDQQLKVTARTVLRVPFYSPGRRAHQIAAPVLAVLADRDEVTPPRPAERAVRQVWDGEVQHLDLDHYEAYLAPGIEEIAARELGFLRRKVPLTTGR